MKNIKEKKGFEIIERESEIDNLIMWLSEGQDTANAELMKDDLKSLLLMDCKYIHSSIETNEYIAIN